MVYEPTVIQYKHHRCRHLNIIVRLKVPDQLNNDLSGGRLVNRHKGKWVIEREQGKLPAQLQNPSVP
jgi:hypothetical protein